jgi:hypothetical protein
VNIENITIAQIKNSVEYLSAEDRRIVISILFKEGLCGLLKNKEYKLAYTILKQLIQ